MVFVIRILRILVLAGIGGIQEAFFPISFNERFKWVNSYDLGGYGVGITRKMHFPQ
jgi:hypothetical protein